MGIVEATRSNTVAGGGYVGPMRWWVVWPNREHGESIIALTPEADFGRAYTVAALGRTLDDVGKPTIFRRPTIVIGQHKHPGPARRARAR